MQCVSKLFKQHQSQQEYRMFSWDTLRLLRCPGKMPGRQACATSRADWNMRGRTVTTVVLVVGLGALFAACSHNGPIAPSSTSNNSPTRPSTSTASKLEFTSMEVSDAGQSALGDWQYKGTVYLRETGGVDLTVTNIQVQALRDSKIFATASITPMLPVPANSSNSTALVFAADTHVQVSALTVNVTVQFTDAKGNSGSISSSFCCFDYWGY